MILNLLSSFGIFHFIDLQVLTLATVFYFLIYRVCFGHTHASIQILI